MTDAAFRRRAEAALAEVERRERVRVLLAIESGSRAWGFASRDSDYDVRFIYVRPLADYLSVAPGRDVIEQPIDDLLDIGGWDVRKALGLMVRSNAVALEWLTSSVVYRQDVGAAAELTALARTAAYPPALEYHYDRLARAAVPAEAECVVRLKSYFYAIRPAMAVLWLRRHGTPPPMDLPALLSGGAAPAAVEARVKALREQKAAAAEADMTPREPVLDAFLARTLEAPVRRPEPWDQAPALMAANRLFLRLLGL